MTGSRAFTVPCIEVDEQLYQRLQEAAKRMETTPEKLLQLILEEWLEDWLTPYTLEEEREVLKRLRELGYG
jgi:predicted transcriptional regulator